MTGPNFRFPNVSSRLYAQFWRSIHICNQKLANPSHKLKNVDFIFSKIYCLFRSAGYLSVGASLVHLGLCLRKVSKLLLESGRRLLGLRGCRGCLCKMVLASSHGPGEGHTAHRQKKDSQTFRGLLHVFKQGVKNELKRDRYFF